MTGRVIPLPVSDEENASTFTDPMLPADEAALLALRIRNADLLTIQRIREYLADRSPPPLPRGRPRKAVCEQCSLVCKNQRGLAIHWGKVHGSD